MRPILHARCIANWKNASGTIFAFFLEYAWGFRGWAVGSTGQGSGVRGGGLGVGI